MEVLLTSEILYQSPEFHKLIRKKLIICTDCIIKNCPKTELEPCISECMKPCTDFKLNYEAKKAALLENLKQDMLKNCLKSLNQELCIKEINSEYLKKLSLVFASYEKTP